MTTPITSRSPALRRNARFRAGSTAASGVSVRNTGQRVSRGHARAVEQAGIAQDLARGGLVFGLHHPHRRDRIGPHMVAIAEVAAQPALVRAAVGDARFDAGLAQQLGDALDVFQARTAEYLPHCDALSCAVSAARRRGSGLPARCSPPAGRRDRRSGRAPVRGRPARWGCRSNTAAIRPRGTGGGTTAHGPAMPSARSAGSS